MPYETPDEGPQPVARAYVYHGEWVADCPRSGCGNVEFLYTPGHLNGPRDQRKPFFMCSSVGCGVQAPVDWPGQEHAILSVLMLRPHPDNRNWYPKDHPVAVNFRLDHGQDVADLLNENEEHGIDSISLRGLL